VEVPCNSDIPLKNTGVWTFRPLFCSQYSVNKHRLCF